MFTASGFIRGSLHRSIWFDLENYILFEQHTADILDQSKSFCSVHLWYWGSSCCCECKRPSIYQIKRGQFQEFFLRREHKFCLEVKMYFVLYFPLSCCEFFMSEKGTVLRVLSKNEDKQIHCLFLWHRKWKVLGLWFLDGSVSSACSKNSFSLFYLFFFYLKIKFLFVLTILFRIWHLNSHKLLLLWEDYAFF